MMLLPFYGERNGELQQKKKLMNYFDTVIMYGFQKIFILIMDSVVLNSLLKPIIEKVYSCLVQE